MAIINIAEEPRKATRKMTTDRLISAARWIKIYHGDVQDVTMIQFEDGSGNCFNYTMSDGVTRFIRWSTLCEGLGYNPDNLCVERKD